MIMAAVFDELTHGVKRLRDIVGFYRDMHSEAKDFLDKLDLLDRILKLVDANSSNILEALNYALGKIHAVYSKLDGSELFERKEQMDRQKQTEQANLSTDTLNALSETSQEIHMATSAIIVVSSSQE